MKAFFAQQEPRPFQGYLLAGLIAVELLMSFSFLGYIHIRPISVTFAYIPVLLAGCLIGPKASVLLGLVFGLASMWKASAPYVAEGDRIFSPFLSQKPLESILLSVGSRVLFGFLIGILFLLARKARRQLLFIVMIALAGRCLHSFLVYSAMGILFPEAGFHAADTLSDLGSPNSLLTSVLTAIVVILSFHALNTDAFHRFEENLLASQESRLMEPKRVSPSIYIILISLISASAIAFYFVQRMNFVLNTSGYDLDKTTRYNLFHLQIQFLLGLLALAFLMSLFLFLVYRHTAHMRYEAKMDSLTQIANRNGFFSLCQQALSELSLPQETAEYFMILDVDHFKQINDTFGHPQGDKVLCDVARILREIFTGKAVFGRLGGDEFAVLVSSPVTAEELKEILNSFQAKVHSIPCADHRVSCSIGAVPIAPHQDIDLLYHRADHCLYLAKSRGRDQFYISDSLFT